MIRIWQYIGVGENGQIHQVVLGPIVGRSYYEGPVHLTMALDSATSSVPHFLFELQQKESGFESNKQQISHMFGFV